MSNRDQSDLTALWVVMGVSGVGKSTLAKALAERCGGEYLDADAFHPPENIRKMKSGEPLTDQDRIGWLSRLNTELQSRLGKQSPVFLACSALKESYRRKLTEGDLPLHFLYLKAAPNLIRERMKDRTDHFMPPALLDSQFATLEEPVGALTLDAASSIAELVEQVKCAYPDLPWS